MGSDNWGKRGHPTNEATAQKHIASEKLDSSIKSGYVWKSPHRFIDHPVIRFDNKIFGRGRKGSNKLQSIRELSVEENSKGNGSISAIRDSIMSRNGWKDHLVLRLIPVRFYDDLEELFNVRYKILIYVSTLAIMLITLTIIQRDVYTDYTFLRITNTFHHLPI